MLDQEGKWQKPCLAIPEPEMDIPRKSAAKKRLIKRIVVGVLILGIGGALFALSLRLKPAAPPVEMSTVWPDLSDLIKPPESPLAP